MVSLLPPSAPSDRSERHVSPSTGDLILDNTAVILSALRKISSVSGVPFLNEAAIVAVRLVNLIRDVRDNNDGFRLLGLDAGKLVWTISTECERLAQAGKVVPTSVQDHIKELITNLRAIETFIESKMLRRKVQKLISYSTDKSEVLRYRDVLRTALDSFAIQASIASQEALHHITETMDNHRVEAIFDRIHQTDTLNRLMQQQSEQMEQLRITMISRYTEEDRLREEREYYARVEHEQQASVAALRAEEERLAEEERIRYEQEQERKNAETALQRKQAAEMLKQMDKQEAEKADAKKRREQAREEREMHQAIAIVDMKEQQEAQRRKKRQEELERQRQQEEEEEERAAKKASAAARKEAREAEEAKEEARRRQQRKAEKQRRDEEGHNEPPRHRPAAGKGTHISATQVEITVTRKGKGSTTKKLHTSTGGGKDGSAHTHSNVAFDGEKFARDMERKMEREFEGFEAEFFDSSSDDDEYWSDDAPRKRRTKAKKSVKASARAGRPHSFVGVDALRAGIQDMAMAGVHSYSRPRSPYYPPHHPPSPYMMPPPPGPYPYEYVTSSNHANATSISVSNVCNSAISFGDTPAVVRNSGNVSIVNISNVGNRY